MLTVPIVVGKQRDILEYIGREFDMEFTSLQTQDSHKNSIETKKTKIYGIEKGFHIYDLH